MEKVNFSAAIQDNNFVKIHFRNDHPIYYNFLGEATRYVYSYSKVS